VGVWCVWGLGGVLWGVCVVGEASGGGRIVGMAIAGLEQGLQGRQNTPLPGKVGIACGVSGWIQRS